MYLTPGKMIELTQRSIDKHEQAFESMRNRMYWMLTITTIVFVPILTLEKFAEISKGWIIAVETLGAFFLLIIILFYFMFVTPKKFPVDSPGWIVKDIGDDVETFPVMYLNELSANKTWWENINKWARINFIMLMCMMLALVIGVIIFMILGGKI